MSTSAGRRRHLATSPFKQDPEPVIEQYEVGDLVQHDSYGMGRVTHVDSAAVTVDFSRQMLRIKSPFDKMAKI